MLAYIKPATRVEATITQGGAGRIWRRIGPLVIDSEPELTELKKLVLDYAGIIRNPAPFAEYNDSMEFEITWVVTDPPQPGTAVIRGYHRGRHCVFQRSEWLRISYSDESVFEYLLKCATERADRKEAFSFEKQQ